MTAAEWTALTPVVSNVSVSIASPPVVTFTVKDANGNPITGLGTKSGSNNANIWFTLAKLVPVTGGPSKWVTYLVTSASTSGTTGAVPDANNAYWLGNFPQRDREGTMVDNGDGTYQYTFFRDITQAKAIVDALPDIPASFKYTEDLGDLTYDPTLTHRLAIVISGNQPRSSPAVAMETPANYTYDFRPDGGTIADTRDVVQRGSCDGCHAGKVIGHSDRRDPKLCVTCHTDQIKYTFDNRTAYTNGEAPVASDGITFDLTGLSGNSQIRPAQAIVSGRAVGNFPNLVHKMHMSEGLVRQGYNYNNNVAGQFNDKKFPQSPANCTKCHDGSATKSDNTANANQTADGDNWMNLPSRLACGACHDGIDFATGNGVTLADFAADPTGATASGHGGGSPVGALTDDATCGNSGCHTPTNIALVHRTTLPTLNNPNVPTGVSTMTYDLSSVTLNASNQPVVTFRISIDGTPVTTLHTSATNPSSTTFELIDGYARGPSIYVAFSVPQDGITAPADFNTYASANLRDLLTTDTSQSGTFTDANGTPTITGTVGSGDITTTDTNGYFTFTMTGTAASPVTIPATASMVTGMIAGRFNKLADSTTLTAILRTKVAAGHTGRRAIVERARCESCHEQLGEGPVFHSGERNDPQACNICHNGNRTSTGWSADSSTFIHGIHGSSKRSVAFTWQAVSATSDYSMVEFPGVLKNCSQCHLTDTVNFGSTGATVSPNLLWSTTASGTISTTTNTFRNSGYVIAGTNYGSGFSYSVATGVTTPAADTTLVNSPIASACFACHDTALAKLHMEGNGGFIYRSRSTVYASTGGTDLYTSNREQCLVCHGKGKQFDVAVVHQ
jgi:OmcA/MtrC family decaheme c-type cytochrome